MAVKKLTTTNNNKKNVITQTASKPATTVSVNNAHTANNTVPTASVNNTTAASNASRPAALTPSMSNLVATNNTNTGTNLTQAISSAASKALNQNTSKNTATTSAAKSTVPTATANNLYANTPATVPTATANNLYANTPATVPTASVIGGGYTSKPYVVDEGIRKAPSLSEALTKAAVDTLTSNSSPYQAYTSAPNVGTSPYQATVEKSTYIPVSTLSEAVTKSLASDTNKVDANNSRSKSVSDIKDASTSSTSISDLTRTKQPAASKLSSEDKFIGNSNYTYDPNLGYGISAEAAYYDPTASIAYDPTNIGINSDLSSNNALTVNNELAPAISIDDTYLRELMEQMLGEYDTNYNSLLETLLSQYNSNTENINSQYENALNALGLNLEEIKNVLQGNYNNSQEALEEQRRRELQEAYIRKMMDQKEMAESLAGYGLSGGATESVLANLLNNYRGNRNTINTNIDTSLKELLANYLGEVSSAQQNYNTALSEMENKKASALQDLLNNYTNAQTSAANARSNYRTNAQSNLYNTLENLYLQDRQNAYNQYQNDLAYQRQIDMANLEAALNNQSKADLLTLEYALKNQYK